MRTAAKVFSVIGLISSILGMITFFIYGIVFSSIIGDAYGLIYWIGAPSLIPSLIVSIKLNKSLDENDKSVALGVCGILFVGLLPGLFYLLWEPISYRGRTSSLHIYSSNRTTSSYSQPVVTTPKPIEKKIEYIKPEDALLSLKQLYDMKIITKAQFEEKSKKYKALL